MIGTVIDVCQNGKNYRLRGKYNHLQTKKHIINYTKNKPLICL